MNRRKRLVAAWSRASGRRGASLYLAVAAADCASARLGSIVGINHGCTTGGVLGTPPAPGSGAVVGCILVGLSGALAGSTLEDFLVDVSAYVLENAIQGRGPVDAIIKSSCNCIEVGGRLSRS